MIIIHSNKKSNLRFQSKVALNTLTCLGTHLLASKERFCHPHFIPTIHFPRPKICPSCCSGRSQSASTEKSLTLSSVRYSQLLSGYQKSGFQIMKRCLTLYSLAHVSRTLRLILLTSTSFRILREYI